MTHQEVIGKPADKLIATCLSRKLEILEAWIIKYQVPQGKWDVINLYLFSFSVKEIKDEKYGGRQNK